MVHPKLWLAVLIVAFGAFAGVHRAAQAQEESAPEPANDCCDPGKTDPQ